MNHNNVKIGKEIINESKNNTHLFYVDVIKVLAALIIIMIHLNANAAFRNKEAPLLANLHYFKVYLGDIGVSLFIIISGLTLSLTNRENFSIKKFFKKRILAIYPSFWITYLFVAIITMFILNKTIGDGHYWKIILTILGLDGFFLYKMSSFYLVGEWYTGFIIITYLFFPVLFWFGNKKPLTTFIGILLMSIVLHINYKFLFKMLENCNPLMRLLDFYFGMMMTLYISKKQRIRNSLRVLSIFYLLFYKLFFKILPYQFHMILVGISIFLILEFLITAFKLSKIHLFAKKISYFAQYTFLAFLIHHQIIIYFYDNIPELVMGNKIMKFCVFLSVVVLSFGYAIIVLPLVKYFTKQFKSILKI